MNLIEKKIDLLIRRLAYKMNISKNNEIPKFKGDKNNPIEKYEYFQKYGIMPVKTIDHGDNKYTHIYEDGTIVDVKVNLISIPLPEDIPKVLQKKIER